MSEMVTKSVRLPEEVADRIIADGMKNGRRFSEQARRYIERGMAAETATTEKASKS